MKKSCKNKNISLAIAFALGCCIWGNSNAFAQEANTKAELAFDLEGITVEAARPDWETKLSPGSVTVIRPEEYKGEQKTLPDLMRKVPGVHVREVNGKGQYTTVTVRGSTAAQVGVFIDGVLSNLGGDAAADLSTIPVANVERIEVYRGYIPARFAGTYIGGVINIVTKKPEKADVSVELGKSSYGGKKGALEITAPLGSGSLMVGANYESSEGDFKYKNYAAEVQVPVLEQRIAETTESVMNFNISNIDTYKNLYSTDVANAFKENQDNWIQYVTNTGSDGFASDYKNSLKSDSSYTPSTTLLSQSGLGITRRDWIDGNVSEDVKEKFYDFAAKQVVDKVNPETSSVAQGLNESIKKDKQKLQEAKNAYRWRKYNDYENINSIIKWQNDEWMVKAAWNKMDRHLPNGVWKGDEAANAPVYNNIDLYDVYEYDARRQIIDTKELMLQNRQTVGKLEWGWLLDYTQSEKEYRAEHVAEQITIPRPLGVWSEYNSDKYNAQIDGTYKLSDNNMLDFQANFSHERMDVDGNNLNDALDENNDNGSSSNDPYQQLRNRYEQDLLNLQIQDTITLDKKSSWFLTPSVRYNRSTITGYSNADRLGDKKFDWINSKDEQTDSKTTWQLALKKQFDDNFTMRMTGGTYYRLLNMYEIAGDGAAIVPAPVSSNNGSMFPVPEEGKQFDISAMWHGNTLGAYNKTSLTYFWRDSDNMLQLQRYGESYWCYMNDRRGTAKGVELQSNFNWSKFDLDIQATYTKTEVQQRKGHGAGVYDYVDVWATYQPEWEGNVRLTYRPLDTLSVFTEVHYTDSYFTDYNNGEGEISGKPVDDLLVFNTGLKFKPKNNWQFTLGCNDVFDQGPKQKVLISGTNQYGGAYYVNPEFPVQGRTFYVTAKYDF